MKTILDLSHAEARMFFLKQESYCSIDLPQYFAFQSLLDALSIEINTKKMKDICNNTPSVKSNYPKNFENTNHTIYSNKDGGFSWRPLQLINPVIYVYLVHKITNKDNWCLIVERFRKFQANEKIRCYSIPILSEEESKSDKEKTISNWWNVIEQQSIELSLNFDYLLNTDISDCYGSIYTHIIPWALHDKDIAKDDRSCDLLGNSIDQTIQAMQYGQTNGIPQGSVVMDFIAEIVLGYADLLLSEKISNENIDNYKILRYRDDYKIFTNSKEDAVKITKLLTEILIGLNLRLNPSKTFISNDIIQDAIKPDKLFWLTQKQGEKTLQKTLLLIHTLAKKHPNSGSVIKTLSDIHKRIYKKDNFDNENIRVLIGIVVDIAYKNPKTIPVAIAILTKLLYSLNDDNVIKDVVDSILRKFKKIPNVGHLEIWLQRFTLKVGINEKYSETLCKKAIGENVEIWNIGWLNDKIKNVFKNNEIISGDYIKNMEPIVKPDEVLIFLDRYN